MKEMNNDPSVEFGSPSFNIFVDFLKNKVGIDLSGFQNNPTQVLNKLIADLYQRLPKKLAGTGIRTQKALEAMAKKLPGIHQSYVSRDIVIDSMVGLSELNLKRIEIAEALKKKNNYRYTSGFTEKVEEKMVPYYKKYFKTIEELPKKALKNKKLQAKDRRYQRRSTGGILGGLAGAAAGVVGGAKGGAMLGAAGGIPGMIGGAALGGLGGLGGALFGSQAGETMAGPIASGAAGLGNILENASSRDFDLPRY